LGSIKPHKEPINNKDSSEVTERESWQDIRDRHTKNDTETCDKEGARQLLNTMKQNYDFQLDSRTNILYVDMEARWHTMDIDTKHRFLRAIANLDACIEGRARHIYIEAWGERVAEATPMGSFKILKY
jgi:hypothetical protein